MGEEGRSTVGSYPKNLTLLFSESEHLDTFVTDECEKRSIEHETVSKESIVLKDQTEPDVEFPHSLKFNIKPMLSPSKHAFKALLSGFPEKISMVDYLSDMSQYEGIKHRNPDSHPLRLFNYQTLVKEWIN